MDHGAMKIKMISFIIYKTIEYSINKLKKFNDKLKSFNSKLIFIYSPNSNYLK